jgi:hypothetical protein
MIRLSRRILVALAIGIALVPAPAAGAGKLSLYLTRMDPTDVDARRFSRTSWGGGIAGVLPFPAVHNLLALTSGVELSNMLSHSTEVYDPFIDETLKQSTNQRYGRFFVGGRLGPHGPAFVRPHIGANVAVVWYGISTTVEIPDPADPDNPITKTLDSNYKGAFGYDVNAGLDLNFANRIPVEIGVRHVQSLNVPQALGEGSVSVSPSYVQVYFGVGINLNVLAR